MKYIKIKDNVGDFNSFNSMKLHEELVGAIGEQGEPQKWYLKTNSTGITVVVLNKDDIDLPLIDAVVRNHFKTDWNLFSPIDAETARKISLMSEIGKAITIKDVKEILKKVL